MNFMAFFFTFRLWARVFFLSRRKTKQKGRFIIGLSPGRDGSRAQNLRMGSLVWKKFRSQEEKHSWRK